MVGLELVKKFSFLFLSFLFSFNEFSKSSPVVCVCYENDLIWKWWKNRINDGELMVVELQGS